MYLINFTHFLMLSISIDAIRNNRLKFNFVFEIFVNVCALKLVILRKDGF